MSLSHFILRALSTGLIVLGADVISAQDYPNKPIRLVTSAAGGGSDFTARRVAQGISGSLGQQVIVDNRPTGVIPAEIVSKALPDGYTLLLTGGTVWVTPLLQNTRYDPVRDFSPVTTVDKSPDILAVHPLVPVASVKELIALAKARPGELNYSTGPVGGPPHLEGELFKAMAGVKIVHIAYKGGGPALSGLLGSEVQMAFTTPSSTMPHVRSGKLKALAITTAEPSALVPGVPTIASSLPGYESTATTAMLAPAKTPAAFVNRLNREIVRFLKTAEAKEQFFNSGVETVGNLPEELAATMKSDIAKWGKLIKDAGIKAN